MAKKISGAKTSSKVESVALRPELPRSARQPTTKPQKSCSLLDTRVVYCGDNLKQLAKLPDACVDLISIRSVLILETSKSRCRCSPIWSIGRRR